MIVCLCGMFVCSGMWPPTGCLIFHTLHSTELFIVHLESLPHFVDLLYTRRVTGFVSLPFLPLGDQPLGFWAYLRPGPPGPTPWDQQLIYVCSKHHKSDLPFWVGWVHTTRPLSTLPSPECKCRDPSLCSHAPSVRTRYHLAIFKEMVHRISVPRCSDILNLMKLPISPIWSPSYTICKWDWTEYG